jgi:hypothetical protein
MSDLIWIIGAFAILPLYAICWCLRLSPWVYKTSYGGARCYARVPGQKLYRNDAYKLWSPCYRIIPGLWICVGKEFYLDDFDFTPLWGRS